jgi:hypothetical protein
MMLHAQDASGPEIEPAAVEALNRMGTHLRSLKSFQVDVDISTEVVLDDGQKVQFAKIANVLARMPDRLFVHTGGDRQERLWYFDGASFTLYAKRVNYYATVKAPPTISQLSKVVEEKYGLEFPLVDLFLWTGDGADTSQIKAAALIGGSQVGGVTCDHYAFRQPGLDWQIWIQKGDFPLPRKLVLTTLTDDARPQFSAVLNWNLAPSFNEATFHFVPPQDARQIVFAEAGGSSTGAGKEQR